MHQGWGSVNGLYFFQLLDKASWEFFKDKTIEHTHPKKPNARCWAKVNNREENKVHTLG